MCGGGGGGTLGTKGGRSAEVKGGGAMLAGSESEEPVEIMVEGGVLSLLLSDRSW